MIHMKWKNIIRRTCINMIRQYYLETDDSHVDLSLNVKFCHECNDSNSRNVSSESSLTFRSYHVEFIEFIDSSSVASTSQSSNSQTFIESQLIARFLQLDHRQAEIAWQKSISTSKLFIRRNLSAASKTTKTHIAQSSAANYQFETYYIMKWRFIDDIQQSIACKEWKWNVFCTSIFIFVWDNRLTSFLNKLCSIFSYQCSDQRFEWLYSMMSFVSDETIYRCVYEYTLRIISCQWLKR